MPVSLFDRDFVFQAYRFFQAPALGVLPNVLLFFLALHKSVSYQRILKIKDVKWKKILNRGSFFNPRRRRLDYGEDISYNHVAPRESL